MGGVVILYVFVMGSFHKTQVTPVSHFPFSCKRGFVFAHQMSGLGIGERSFLLQIKTEMIVLLGFLQFPPCRLREARVTNGRDGEKGGDSVEEGTVDVDRSRIKKDSQTVEPEAKQLCQDCSPILYGEDQTLTAVCIISSLSP